MENDIDALSILAEVTIAFVAFVTIVASIKLSLGDEMTPYQRLVIHYFTESSMLAISILLLTIVLIQWFPGRTVLVSRISCIYAFIATALYLVWYMKRRIAIKAPTPVVSMLVIFGYFLMIVLLGITISGIYWQPSIKIIEAIGLWNLAGSAVIFTAFLGSFIDKDSVM